MNSSSRPRVPMFYKMGFSPIYKRKTRNIIEGACDSQVQGTFLPSIFKTCCVPKLIGVSPCADPEEGTGGPDPPPPPWNLKILPKKGNFRIVLKVGPPSSVTKNYHFRWTPSHENIWIRACISVIEATCNRRSSGNARGTSGQQGNLR